MILTDMAIERRTTVMVLLLLIIILGGLSAWNLPRESEPEVVIPIANIAVVYQGVAPEDMETLVTIPIERKLTGISGVKQISSSTNEGLSSILVEFEADVDVDVAIQKVKDKVDQARPDLPDDAEEPIITDLNMAESPVIFVNLTGTVGLMELTKIAEHLEDKIESLSGVMDVEIIGDREREIQIVVDPIRLLQYGVSMNDLVQIAQVENLNTPAGSTDVGEAKYLMRVPGEIETPEDLQGLVVKRGETGVVYMRDLAEIRDGAKDPISYARMDGLSSVTLVASKRSGVNIIHVSRDIKEVIEEARETLPAGVTLSITLDESKRIDEMVWQLFNSIGSGLVLVLIVIFLFMGISNALFVALAIPISLFITFIVMQMTGLTLNMVTLFSLMVSLGMLVDNGIVVVENIYRHAQNGLPRVAAAKKGASEVAWPIIGSTLTTVAAFFPMIFWPGIMGRFMNLLPKTVIITLFASLFVGLIVNPALASIFVKTRSIKEGAAVKERRHIILGTYARVLRTALHWRFVTITLAVTLLVTIIGIFSVNPRFEFLSSTEPDRAYVDVEMSEGTNLDTTNMVTKEIEKIVEGGYSGNLDYLLASVGSLGPSVREGMPGSMSKGDASHVGRVTLVFPDFHDRTTQPTEIISELRHAFDDIVGAEIHIGSTDMGPPSGAPINIELVGEDFAVLDTLTRQIRDAIITVPGLVDLQDDLELGKPEVRIVIDREQASLLNLNSAIIGLTVQAAIHGRKAGEYREGDDEYDVVVTFPEEFGRDLAHIEGMTFTNTNGLAIPFSAVAKLEKGVGLGNIKRKDRKRMVTIKADAEGRLGTEVLADVQEVLGKMALPTGYAIRFTGENEETKNSGEFMQKAFFVALFLIALVLITQFNSIIQPLIIMSSVILSLGGVFLGLIIFNMPFSLLMTGIGCISLAGIVVNNAIVLVDLINNLRKEGMPAEEAIVLAGKTRFRPVLLTTVTTILGLLPLGLGISFDFRSLEMVYGGDQSSYWGAMAIAIIFGLAFATFLTLIVVPTLYSMMVSFIAVMGGDKSSAESPTMESVAK
ncbi:MAG: acriflavin resistance protein [Candidatus Hydrogenedentota bacterium]|nr:MAG: acriflavin resistance protein [Candidatus Hydrogenedentota bacterium]